MDVDSDCRDVLGGWSVWDVDTKKVTVSKLAVGTARGGSSMFRDSLGYPDGLPEVYPGFDDLWCVEVGYEVGYVKTNIFSKQGMASDALPCWNLNTL